MSESAETKVFRISHRCSVEITIGMGGMTVEWIPKMPNKLTEKEKNNYYAARDSLINKFAQKTGKQIIVVNV